MSGYRESLSNHYGRAGLAEAILAALRDAGIDPGRLTREDLKAIDEFHTRGVKATRELAGVAGVRSGMKVLDLGCGIGGPARTLAAEFGCDVLGVDVMDEYCRTATRLTELVGLSDRVKFQTADIASLEFERDAFDLVSSQHTIMNIEDKERMFGRIHHALRPGGRYAFHEVCAGSKQPLCFPVPWADDASISFPVSPDELRALIDRAGFTETVFDDLSDSTQRWFQTAIEKSAQQNAPHRPGIHLLMGDTTLEKMRNMVRNLSEDRIRVVQGVFTKHK